MLLNSSGKNEKICSSTKKRFVFYVKLSYFFTLLTSLLSRVIEVNAFSDQKVGSQTISTKKMTSAIFDNDLRLVLSTCVLVWMFNKAHLFYYKVVLSHLVH